MAEQLGDRQRRLLRAVIHEYIRSAQPVASEALVRRYRLGVSSATVRNDLALLEDQGLLTHPHTSAGRIPTAAGYRYFIESLMDRADLEASEEMMVRHQFHQLLDTSQWIRLAVSVLARLSRGASLATMPRAEHARVKHLETIPILDQRALVVAVLDGGVVRQQVLELPAPQVSADLRATSARLSDALAGKDAPATRELASRETGHARAVAEAVARVLEEEDHAQSRDVYYDGVLNLLRQPEFTSSEALREMFGVLEDRMLLAGILPASLGAGEVSVRIGDENPLEPLRHFSLVLGRYGTDSGSSGYVGIVGPTRMDYARSIGAVRYVGGLMTELLRTVDA